MTLAILFAYILSICFSIPLLAQPVSLGINILLLALVVSMTSVTQVSSWFGFILVLIYIGGLLVMFAYVTALIPNMMFKQLRVTVFQFSLFILFLFMFFMSKISTLSDSFHELEVFPWISDQSKISLILSSNFNLGNLNRAGYYFTNCTNCRS
uniref:NADH dehydrogenase subunit 6 n=1 Tax=Hanleyella oldroydi TaxID=515356 RepID=A0A6H1PHL1_9MOLL|nr:NADH dehydrogenase subunit 6 [Hanleyella oldroydi]QIZ12621.1 NADH dehydrogenase subunit 6 [Hanleyella oldroydi]